MKYVKYDDRYNLYLEISRKKSKLFLSGKLVKDSLTQLRSFTGRSLLAGDYTEIISLDII